MVDSNLIDRSSTYADVLILLDTCITQACSQSTLYDKWSQDPDLTLTHSHEVELELSVNEPVAIHSDTRCYNHLTGIVLDCVAEVHSIRKENDSHSHSLSISTDISDSEKGVGFGCPFQSIEDDVNCKSESSKLSMKVKNETGIEVTLTDSESNDISYFGEMPKKPKNSLQEAFLHFRKKKQDEIKQERRRRDAILRANADPKRMEALRVRIIAQAKKYFGVPYKRKYWDPSTPEYHSPIFLDCCGLVRQVIRDLEPELGFRLGPWNQSYMYDTLPVTLKKEQMKPGDLVFMKGLYTSTRTKKQRHNMTHVEIWLGEGDKTIGSRWNNGKVGEFESYKFSPKSFHSEEYIFKSIDTWLMGICHSYCSKHPWRVAKYNPTCKSIFNVTDEKEIKDEKAEPDTDDEEVNDGGDDNDDDNNDNGADDDVYNKMEEGGGDSLKKMKNINNNNSRDKNRNIKNENMALDPSMVSLKLKSKGGGTTHGNETGGLTPRSHVTDSPCSNSDTPVGGGSRTPRSKSNKTQGVSKQLKPAKDAYVIETDVRKTGQSVSKFKKQDLGRMASHALKRRNKIKQEDSSVTVTPTPIPIVGNCNSDELQYIPANMPANMPSRINTPSSSHWVPTKDRERRMKKERESAFVHPNQRTATWNLHHSEKNPNFSIIGSKDSNMPKVSSCPNLEQSDVNLLFKANTSFFESGAVKDGVGNGHPSDKSNVLSRKREKTGNRSTKQVDMIQKKDIRGGNLEVTRAGRGARCVEDCLIVSRSPSFVRDMDKAKGEEDQGFEGDESEIRPLTSTSILQEIKKRHSIEQSRQAGNFSQIQEEESLVPEVNGSEKQSIQTSDMKNYKDKMITDRNEDGEMKNGSLAIEMESFKHKSDVEGRESKLKVVDMELKSLCFSEEVIQDTARSLTELENAEDCNTSLCSDFDYEEDENGILVDKSDNCSRTSGSRLKRFYENDDGENDNNDDGKDANVSDSDENTDDEFQSAMEMTVLNHRALDASTAIFIGEGYRHNFAWEWLHALKAGELHSEDNNVFDTGDNRNNNSEYIEYYLSRDGNCGEENVIDEMRDIHYTNLLAYRKHSALPPINTLLPSIPIDQAILNNQKVLYSRGVGDNLDANSMDVVLPQTRQTGLRPSIQADNTFYEGFPSQSKTNNLLAHYVLNQCPKYCGDTASSEVGSFSADDCYSSTTHTSPETPVYLTTPSLIESSASCRSLSSEDLLPLQQSISRQQKDLMDASDQKMMMVGDRSKCYIVTPAPSSSVQEGDGDDESGWQDRCSFSVSQGSRSNSTIGRHTCSEYTCQNGSAASSLQSTGKRPSTTSADKPKTESNDSKEQSSSVGSNGKPGRENSSAKSTQGGDERGGNGDEVPKGKQPTAGGGGGVTSGGGDGSGSGNPGSGGNTGGGNAGGNGGGGGGNRKPVGGRPSKLPACSLPNNMQPTFYIGGGNGTALVEAPLLNLGWKRITDKYDERYRLKWVECKSKINYAAFKEGEQLVNHIPNCKLLTNKLGLLSSLQEYERVTLLTKGRFPRMKMADFVPETYKLDERNDREKFLNEYKDNEVWICKPTGLNQGKGIFLLRSRAEIDQLLLDRDAKNQSKTGSRPPMMRIVQRYIKNPLLLDSRKFDIRAYMLIASTVPYLILYNKGYVRLSVIKYDNEDTNLTAHLTNQYIQKKDPSYKDVKEDSAWSMDKFNDYINDNFASEHGLEKDWVYGNLTKQMQRIILHCFNAVKHKLQSKVGYFDLYGMDFMVDTDFKVWLIEINVNPALHTNCEALKEIIPDVVEESLHLSIECFDKSRKGQSLMPLNSLRSFNVLYCGTSPNAVAPRQTRSVSPSKDGVEKTRPTGTAPSTRRASPPRNLPRMSVVNTQMSSQPAPAGNTTCHSQSSPYANKRASISSTLPTINIGATIITKKSASGSGSGGGVGSTTNTSSNSSNTKQQQQQPTQPQSQSQQPKQQQQQSQHQQEQVKQPTSEKQQQQQQQKFVPPQDIGLALGDDQQAKLRMTHSDFNKKRNRDYSSRGN